MEGTPAETRLRRDRQEPVLVDAAVVESIKKKRKVMLDGHESEDDEGDHTMLKYCSDPQWQEWTWIQLQRQEQVQGWEEEESMFFFLLIYAI